MKWGSLFSIVAGVGCTMALAACGGSSPPLQTGTGAANPSAHNSAIAFAGCMRSHGVPNLPDPAGGGGGIQIPSGSGINPQSPAFRSAQNACAKLLPGGGPPRGPVSAARKLQMLKLSECMRAHGLTSFPDPTTSPPANPQGMGVAFGTPGAFIAVPQSLMQSPAFKSAASACQFPGG